MKAQVLTNIAEFNKAISVERAKSTTFTEELLNTNKLKYNLGLTYFAAVTVLSVTLFL